MKRLPWVLMALVVLILLAGCSRQPAVADLGLSEPQNLAQARAAWAKAQAALAGAEARVQALEQAAGAARVEGQRRLLGWASALAVLGALLCAGLAFALPALRRPLAAAAAGCGGVLLAAQVIGHLLPWLPLAGGALALLALAYLLWRALRALRDSVGLADQLKNAAANPAELLNWARVAQAKNGTRPLIQRVRTAYAARSAPSAPAQTP
jgi:hypothetical protein